MTHPVHIQTVFLGVTYMNAILASLVSVVAGFGIGWYVKGRGLAGVKIDAGNVKTEVEATVAAA